MAETNEFSGKISANPAFINEKKNEANCSAIAISHIEGDSDIEEVIMFRLELDVFPSMNDTEVYLEIDMLFHEDNNVLPPDSKKDGGDNILSSIRFKIDDIASGIHEYIAGNFLSSNYSILNMTFHSVLCEYRYRIIDKPITEISENEIYNLIFKSKDIPEETRKVSMTKYILDNLKTESVESFCSRLKNDLVNQHESLLKMYNLIYGKCLFDKHKAKFNEYLQNRPTKLEIPDPLQDPEFINSLKEFNIDIETIKNFTKQVPSERLSNFLIEISYISGEILYLWHKYIDLIRISPKFVCCFFEFDYLDNIKSKWQKFITSNILTTDEWRVKIDSTYRPALPLTRFKMSPFNESRPIKVTDVSLFKEFNKFPDVMEQIVCKGAAVGPGTISNSDNYKGIHLIILVHGFQGNSYDMKLVKNNLLLLRPELLIYCSQKNEDDTEGDIGDMGKNLAEEVSEYIRDFCPGSALGRLSFIGYSLGGIIVRAALPHLSQYLNAGMWLLKKIKNKNDALHQLTMDDAKDLTDTFVYKLGTVTEISNFKHVILFGSEQDTYCPFDSATIQISEKLMSETKGKAEVSRQMVTNIIGNIKAKSLIRVNIKFNGMNSNLDTFLGRAAHIQYLENDTLVKILVSRYESCFA